MIQKDSPATRISTSSRANRSLACDGAQVRDGEGDLLGFSILGHGALARHCIMLADITRSALPLGADIAQRRRSLSKHQEGNHHADDDQG
jgi:hypothetical protein